MEIERVGVDDLPALAPLMRAYCDFYRAAATDDQLVALARVLIADPEREGEQLLARESTTVLGFATLFWTWSTTSGGRIGVMNDLYVVPRARGRGVGRALIARCRDRCAQRGAGRLQWVTRPDNHQAQALYDGTGAHRDEWVTYVVGTTPSG